MVWVWARYSPKLVQAWSRYGQVWSKVGPMLRTVVLQRKGARSKVQVQVRLISAAYSSSSSSSAPIFFRNLPAILAALGFFSSSHSKTFLTPHSTPVLRESASAVETFSSSMQSETTLPRRILL